MNTEDCEVGPESTLTESLDGQWKEMYVPH
jgi:hypothetical protein